MWYGRGQKLQKQRAGTPISYVPAPYSKTEKLSKPVSAAGSRRHRLSTAGACEVRASTAGPILEPIASSALVGTADTDAHSQSFKTTRPATVPGSEKSRLSPLGRSVNHHRSLPNFRRNRLPLMVYPDASGGRPDVWNRVNITTKAVKDPWGDEPKETWGPMREAWATIAADPSGQTFVMKFLKPTLPSLRNSIRGDEADLPDLAWSRSASSADLAEMEEVFGSVSRENVFFSSNRKSSSDDILWNSSREEDTSPHTASMRISINPMHKHGTHADFGSVAGSNTSATRVTQVFQRLERGKQITAGKDLAEAMNWLGHPYPAAVWLQEAINAKCSGRSSLDLEDFTEVVAIYEEKLNSVLEDVFRRCSGGRQTVDMMEVPDMLVRSGVPFMPGAYAELVSDFRTNAEKRGKHICDFNMFKIANNKVMWHAGLTRAEADFLKGRFERFAKDGHISQDDMVQALSWNDILLELAGGKHTVPELVNEVASRSAEGRVSLNLKSWESPIVVAKSSSGALRNDRGLLSRTDFFAAGRVLHDRIEKGFMAVVGRLGRKSDQPFGIAFLVTIFEAMGFYGALEDSVQYFLDALDYKDHGLTFEEAYAVMLKFCKADGLTEHDVDEIEQTFGKFDLDGSRTLELEELGPVLRWLGYQPSQYRVYDFAETFGLEETSEIDMDSFIKLSASYMTMSLHGARNVFLVRPESCEYQRVSASKMEELLHLVGYDPTQAEKDQLVHRAGGPSALISFRQFKLLEREHRRRVKDSMERNGGYTDKDLERYRTYFEKNDPGNTGYITHKAMRELFLELFPDTKENSQRHAKIVQMVNEADADGNRQIDFHEYVTLFRGVTQEMDRDILQRGLKLKKELGYSSAEVKQFRELYNACDADLSGSVDSEELSSIFAHLIHMHKEAQRDLKQIVQGFSTNGQLSFWQFLSLMSHVQRINWRDINDIAGERGLVG